MNGLAACAGIGGIELGLKLCLGDSYRTVCYVEREAFAAATLVARMEDEALDPAPIWDDIETFDGTAWRGTVDIVSCGFPCQPFSVAGSKRGVEDERWIWPHIARVIAESEPQLVFLENVPPLVGHGLRVVWTDLRRLGFGIRAGFFSAAEVGAPHRRQRIFILAYTDRGRQQVERLEERAGEFGESGRESDRYGFDGREFWPPPPGSREWPNGLEPAVRRVAPWLQNRVDRLRVLGNSVMPLVAAHAFRTLWKEVSE